VRVFGRSHYVLSVTISPFYPVCLLISGSIMGRVACLDSAPLRYVFSSVYCRLVTPPSGRLSVWAFLLGSVTFSTFAARHRPRPRNTSCSFLHWNAARISARRGMLIMVRSPVSKSKMPANSVLMRVALKIRAVLASHRISIYRFLRARTSHLLCAVFSIQRQNAAFGLPCACLFRSASLSYMNACVALDIDVL